MGKLSTKTHKRGIGPKRARRLVGTESGDSESHKPAEKPISLRPLQFEEAVRGLLQVGRKDNNITPTKAGAETGDGK